MTTTGSAAVATLGHGPIAARVGLNSSTNCLGPGNRANATIAQAMTTSVVTSASSGRGESPEQVMLLPPEVAHRLAAVGMDVFAVQASLYERGLGMPRPASAASTPMARSAADIHPIVCGGPGQKIVYLPLWGGRSLTVTKPLILL